jgi:TRAP-type C4-dicarboxylate transport system permease small subunit
MSLTVVVAASIAWAAVQKGHVSVNIITMAFGRKTTRVTDVLARTVSCAMMAFAGYALFIKGSCGFECGAMTSNLGIIHTPFYYILATAMCLYASLIACHLLIGLAHWQGSDPNEIKD